MNDSINKYPFETLKAARDAHDAAMVGQQAPKGLMRNTTWPFPNEDWGVDSPAHNPAVCMGLDLAAQRKEAVTSGHNDVNALKYDEYYLGKAEAAAPCMTRDQIDDSEVAAYLEARGLVAVSREELEDAGLPVPTPVEEKQAVEEGEGCGVEQSEGDGIAAPLGEMIIASGDTSVRVQGDLDQAIEFLQHEKKVRALYWPKQSPNGLMVESTVGGLRMGSAAWQADKQ